MYDQFSVEFGVNFDLSCFELLDAGYAVFLANFPDLSGYCSCPSASCVIGSSLCS